MFDKIMAMTDAQKVDALVEEGGMEPVAAFYFLMDCGELSFDGSCPELVSL